MAFYSIAFFCFVLVYLSLHELAGRFASRLQWVVRLAAGISFFFMLSGFRVIFLLISALSIWAGGVAIYRQSEKSRICRSSKELTKEEQKAEKKRSQRINRIWSAAVIIFNLMILFLVKYFFPTVGHPVALPLGISFYTLQAVAYIVDVCGGKYEPQKNPAKLLLYLCWFPQLIQGPVNRYDLIERDLYGTHRLCAFDLKMSFYLFLFGAVKKYAIADMLAPVVNASLNGEAAAYPGSFLLTGAVLYAIEQYADFSGGIDMAMAVSALFGVNMNENFRQPYLADSLAEFWRRWHISLGAWMRDYVFYPFAITKPVKKLTKTVTRKYGSHVGRAVTGGISNLLVFALVGLWHGPEKHFLAWGLYNGVIIAVSDAAAPLFATVNKKLRIRSESRPFHCFRIIRTFMIVVFAGFFDVIGSVRTGLSCFVNTFLHFEPSDGMGMLAGLFEDGTICAEALVTAAVSVAILATVSIFREKGVSLIQVLCLRRYWQRWVVCFLLIFILLYSFTVSSGIRGFMYAAF